MAGRPTLCEPSSSANTSHGTSHRTHPLHVPFSGAHRVKVAVLRPQFPHPFGVPGVGSTRPFALGPCQFGHNTVWPALLPILVKRFKSCSWKTHAFALDIMSPRRGHVGGVSGVGHVAGSLGPDGAGRSKLTQIRSCVCARCSLCIPPPEDFQAPERVALEFVSEHRRHAEQIRGARRGSRFWKTLSKSRSGSGFMEVVLGSLLRRLFWSTPPFKWFALERATKLCLW